MKEVKKDKIKLGKDFLLILYGFIKEGKAPKDISKQLSISKQSLNYYLTILKSKGYISKIGYGLWKANEIISKNDKLGNLQSKKVRGHAFVWKVKLPKHIDWKSLLEIKGVNYELVNKSTPRIIIKGKKVWLGQENVVIYDLESYFGANSVEAKKYAINRLLEVIHALERELGISLRKGTDYIFTVSRNHYSLIKNCLAIQCNKEGKKIQVSNDKGMWFLIDNSFNLDEAETTSPKTALPDNIGIQKYFNEHKETHFEVTPKFILNSLTQLTNALAQSQTQLLEYNKQNIKHLKLIQEYRRENKLWRKEFSKKLIKESKEQKRLFDFTI